MNINNNLELSGFLPNLYDSLNKVNHQSYFFQKHGFRPPLWIYRKKLSSISASGIELLEYLQLDSEVDKDKLQGFVKRYINSIDDLFDMFGEITLGFFDIIRNSKFIHQDLKKNNIEEWELFYQNLTNKGIKDSIDYFKNLSNTLNHSTPSIEFIEMKFNENCVKGFFITQVNKDGCIIPDPKFHPQWGGMNTGTSFTHLIKQSFFLVYYVSDLFEHFVISSKEKVNEPPQDKFEDDDFKKFYELIDMLGFLYFPNEEPNEQFEPKIHGNKMKIQAKIPRSNKSAKKFHLTHTGDGATKSFCILYYNGKKGKQ